MKLKILRTEKSVVKVVKTSPTKKVKKTRRAWNVTLGKYTYKKIKPRKARSTPKQYTTSININGKDIPLKNDGITVEYMCLDCYEGTNYDHECKIYDYEHPIAPEITGDGSWEIWKKQITNHKQKVRVIVSMNLDPKDMQFVDVPLTPPEPVEPPPPKTISSRIQV